MTIHSHPLPASDSVDWLITVTRDWREVSVAWERLSADVAAPFQSPAWVSAWFDHAETLGVAQPLVAIGTSRADQQPEIVLPLCLYRRHGLRVVSPPDHGVTDYVRIPAAPEIAQDADRLKSFFAALPSHLPPHDVFQISRFDAKGGVSPDDIFAPGHVAELSMSAWSTTLGQPDHPPPIQRLTRNLRKTVGQAQRSIEKVGKRRVATHWPVTDRAPLDVIWQMRRRRMETKGRSDVVEDGWLELYLRLAESNSEVLSLNATILYAGDAAVAASLGIRSGSSFVAQILTMEPGMADRYSPGMQVALENLAEAERQGVEIYDLSIGDQSYKRRFGCDPRPLWTIVVPRSVSGYAAWAAWRGRHRLRAYRERKNATS